MDEQTGTVTITADEYSALCMARARLNIICDWVKWKGDYGITGYNELCIILGIKE